MHAKPDLRVLLKWMIIRSGSVITDVIRASRFESTGEASNNLPLGFSNGQEFQGN